MITQKLNVHSGWELVHCIDPLPVTRPTPYVIFSLNTYLLCQNRTSNLFILPKIFCIGTTKAFAFLVVWFSFKVWYEAEYADHLFLVIFNIFWTVSLPFLCEFVFQPRSTIPICFISVLWVGESCILHHLSLRSFRKYHLSFWCDIASFGISYMISHKHKFCRVTFPAIDRKNNALQHFPPAMTLDYNVN